ncbi:MAG: universal stress protein, partial [Desulfuromonadales bacterium]
MKQINSILFATDFSDSSGPAAEYAITMAELTGAHLHVLHVINELDEHQRVMIPHEAFQ